MDEMHAKLLKAWDDVASVEGAEEENYETYGLWTVTIDRETWALGTDEECDKAAEQHIEESVWAFRAEYICSACGLPSELAEALEAFQRDKCEDANKALAALVERTCGMKQFAESAVAADGRGNFLSSYDGDEVELGQDGDGRTVYGYRVN